MSGLIHYSSRIFIWSLTCGDQFTLGGPTTSQHATVHKTQTPPRLYQAEPITAQNDNEIADTDSRKLDRVPGLGLRDGEGSFREE